MTEKSKPRILIIDDDPENIHALMGALQAEYSIVAATDGARGLALAENTADLDLILLDVVMPDMNGFEVCQCLKSNARLRDVPVIFVTVLGETSDKVRGFDLGGQDYITKPFQYEEVHARIRTHVSLYRLQRELRASNRRLRELEQFKENLTQMIVHDLRSPLTVATGCLEMCRLDVYELKPAEIHEVLTQSLEALDSIHDMVEQILDVGRLEEHRLKLSTDPCDVLQLVKNAAKKVALDASGHELDFRPSEPVRIPCDSQLIERVFQNLITNAIKFSPAGSRIEVSVTAGEDMAGIVVSDEGRGVSPDHQDRVFDKFYQTEDRDQRRGKGLGLAFCKLAIEAHGGQIGVNSGEKEGAEFWFTLPVRRIAAESVKPAGDRKP